MKQKLNMKLKHRLPKKRSIRSSKNYKTNSLQKKKLKEEWLKIRLTLKQGCRNSKKHWKHKKKLRKKSLKDK